MSSEQRTSSAVRNLRSMFENKASLDTNSPDSRGRSPSALSSDKENGGRQTSKVRASFVPVAPVVGMATAAAEQSLNVKSEDVEGGNGVKEAAGQQKGKQETSDGGAQSTAGAASGEKVQEGESGQIKAAEPTNEAALPPFAEDLRSSTRAKETVSKPSSAKTTSKPAPVSTKAAAKPSPSAVKSPARSPLSPPAAKAPTKKPSRSSLTAPTAASMAHMRAAAEKASNANGQTTAATKKREVTKPISLPSHLTAPTASSRAKHENPPAASSSTVKPTTTSRPKPTSSARPTPRTSLAAGHRPAAETSQAAPPRRSVAPADSSFLERMMKPTAASASKSHDKPVEAKTPPKTKAAPPKAKVNGVTKKAGASSKAAAAEEPAKSEPVQAVEEESPVDGESAPDIAPAEVQQSVPEPVAATDPVVDQPVEKEIPKAEVETRKAEVEAPKAAVETPKAEVEASKTEVKMPKEHVEAPKTDVAGNQTPIPATEDEPANAALEATPAGIVGEETIR